MTVRFVFKGDKSYYVFPSTFVEVFNSFHREFLPFGIRISYERDTDMFSFLDSEISPSCIENVMIFSDGGTCDISFIFNIDHIPLDQFESYVIPLADDLELNF